MNHLLTNIDDNGRIELPLAIRYGLHLMPGDRIAIDQLGDGTIILKKIEEQAVMAAKDMSEMRLMQLHVAQIHA
ncbi:MAG TPA: AbrB/MazE/SpoVT family DNA-binding domain-containing protein [Methanothrix sp.]|nr:AbrB/MazE/SpoVT family DNA-binding domain-containing protein [Methanothrix sp.]